MSNKRFINPQEDSISNYLKDVRKSEIIDYNKEIQLAKRIQEGDKKALEELVSANLRFVISIAKDYQNQGLPLADLISEGNYGLMVAANRFDYTKGFRFISYAVWWIKQSIMQSLNENTRTVRLPTNIINKLSKLRKEIDEFEKKFERKPVEGQEIEFIFHPSVTSLNNTVNEEGTELIELIEDTNAYRPDLDTEKENQLELKEQIDGVLSILSEREKSIIEMYYGLKGNPLTLEEIGEEFNLTKERVRQLKVKSLRKLRSESVNLRKLIFD
jgi:RNA polymerase primary sigma factor